MRTDSIRLPSASRKRNFRVVSSEPVLRMSFQFVEGKGGGELGAQRGWEIGHLLEGASALLIEPPKNLPATVSRLPQCRERLLDLGGEQRADRTFSG